MGVSYYNQQDWLISGEVRHEAPVINLSAHARAKN